MKMLRFIKTIAFVSICVFFTACGDKRSGRDTGKQRGETGAMVQDMITPFGKRNYYTDAVLKTMAQNMERYDWARTQRDDIIKRADRWLKYDDATLRTLVTPPEVLRANMAHAVGAPVNGEELKKFGVYSWIVSFDQPYKIKSPFDGKVYPSNDFLKFYRSGLNTNGVFDPKLADRALLTGPYADDGQGCKVEGFDKPFWFVAVYAHWSVERLLLPALDDLSQAYLITNDKKYAHACLLLLWQLADYYPRYFYEKQSVSPLGDPTQKGRLLYHTWESLYTCHTAPPAYDAVKLALPNALALQKITGQTADEIRSHIEERILRTMASDIMDGSCRIQGNYGMHQLSLARIAAVLKDRPGKPSSDAMIAWILRNPGAEGDYTQLGLEDAVNNLLHRDGYAFESPGYNCGWMEELGALAVALGDDGKHILAMPRFRKLFTWPMRMAVAGEFIPSYGDSGHLFQSTPGWGKKYLEMAFRVYRDPLFAKAMVSSAMLGKGWILQKGVWVRTTNTTAQASLERERNLFREPFEDIIEKTAAGYPQPLGITSELLPGVGFASLQTGSDSNRSGLAIFYGYYTGHEHFDRLQLDIYSWRNALTPDFGYPETANSRDPRRYGWLSHTASHNTLMINAKRQEIKRGRLHVFDPGFFAQLVEVSAEDAYPGLAKLYRRTLMLVEVNPEQAFIVDIFRVQGGMQHDLLVHGTQAEFLSDLPFSAPRKEGTLAGPDVPYGYFYDDRRYDDNNKANVSYYDYRGSAFQWLFNVQAAALNGSAAATWRLNRPPDLFPARPRAGVALRAHLVGKDEKVFACDGVPQQRKDWPETVKFLVRRRNGTELESVFVTVFEPYKNTPFIKSVRALPVKAGGDLPVALEIYADGKRYVVFNRLESEGTNSVLHLGDTDVDARAAVLCETAESRLADLYLLDAKAPYRGHGTTIPATPAIRTEVMHVDYAKGEITLKNPRALAVMPAGNVAIVESGLHANAVPVKKIVAGNRFTVGDDDLMAGAVHVTEVSEKRILTFNPRFIYFVEPGMTVINETGKVMGRVKSIGMGEVVLDSPVIFGDDDFPDLDGDGRRTIRFMVVGPGDRVVLHVSTRRGKD